MKLHASAPAESARPGILGSIAGTPRAWKLAIAIFLVPLCYLSTQTFLEALAAAGTGRAFWSRPELWSFLVGALSWLLLFLLGYRPLGAYVLGHELTHALFTYMCGGDVTRLYANRSGGYVHTTKTNTLISLSPYLFPFYTLILLAIASLASLFLDLYSYHPNILLGIGLRPIWILLALIGLTWAFHLTFTIWMISREQPDLQENGNYFSVLLIYLVNLLILCAFIILASPSVGISDFFQGWAANAGALVDLGLRCFKGIAAVIGHLFER